MTFLAISSMPVRAARKLFLSGCPSGVSSMMAPRSKGYLSSHCTGLMRSEARSHACETEETTVWVYVRYSCRAGVCGRLCRCSSAEGWRVM